MSITSANAVYTLAIASVLTAPQNLSGFSTDELFDGDRITSAQVQMGVDGTLSAGFVFQEYKQNISLQADSPSIGLFDSWWATQQGLADLFPAYGLIILSGIGTKYVLTKGFLTGYPPIPDAGKLLKPRKFEITWERVLPVPSL